MSIAQVFVNPDSYFHENGGELGYTVPLVVVGGTAACSMVAAGVQISVLTGSVTGTGSNTVLAIVGIASIIASIFTPFLSWLLFTAVIYSLARLRGGVGTFRRTFRAIGYGYLPSLLGSVLVVLTTTVVVTSTVPPSSPEGIQPFLARVKTHPIYRSGQIANLAGFIWSGFLWVFGTKHTHDIDDGDAVIAVAIPVLAGVAVSFFVTM